MRDAWEALVSYFAGDRPICNCGCAFATFCPGDEAPEKERTCGGCANTPHGHTFCEGGCSAAQIDTREEIAKKVWKQAYEELEAIEQNPSATE